MQLFAVSLKAPAGASGGGSAGRGRGQEGRRRGRAAAAGGARSQDRHGDAARVQRAVSCGGWGVGGVQVQTVTCGIFTDCPTSRRRRTRTIQSESSARSANAGPHVLGDGPDVLRLLLTGCRSSRRTAKPPQKKKEVRLPAGEQQEQQEQLSRELQASPCGTGHPQQRCSLCPADSSSSVPAETRRPQPRQSRRQRRETWTARAPRQSAAGPGSRPRPLHRPAIRR